MDQVADARESLAVYLKRIRAAFKELRVILFGSRARGDAREWSDYDLLLISPSFEGVRDHDRLVHAGQLMLGTGLDIDTICLTPEEFERRRHGISIVGEAAKEGIDLAS